MSPEIIDFRILFMFFTATVWFLTDTIAFLLSGKHEGDFYFFRHPEKMERRIVLTIGSFN